MLRKLATISVTILLIFSNFFNLAYAASLTSKSDTMSSLKVSTASNHTIKFRTPTGVDASSDTMTVTFPSGWTMGSVAFGDMDLEIDSACDGTYETAKAIAATAAASTWGAAVSGQVITLTAPTNASSGEIAANSCAQVEIGTNATTGTTGINQIANSASSGSHTITVAGAFGDSGNILVNLLSDDQVAVSATVLESLTFSISDNTIGFGTLSSSAARYATGDATGSTSEVEAHNLVTGTNAANGYTVTVKGATLTSGSFTITAIGGTNTASATSTEQFGVRMTATGGSGTVTAPYDGSGFAYAGTATTASQTASASGSTANTTYSIRYLANIAPNTEAGSYSATLTYVATGNF